MEPTGSRPAHAVTGTEATERSQTDEFGRRLYSEEDRAIVQAAANVADKRGISRAQVALAWLLSKPVISAPIVGVTSSAQLADALGAAVSCRVERRRGRTIRRTLRTTRNRRSLT